MYNDRSRPAYPLPGVTGMPKDVLEATMCLLKNVYQAWPWQIISNL